MKKIVLKSMTETEFEHYFQDKLSRYTDVLSQNIHELGEAPSVKALNQLEGLLPNGIQTPNHHLFNVQLENKGIGYVWLKVEEEKKSAFLYEIYILEEYRTNGYGTETMECIEDFLRQKDILYFKLHVFGSNTGARKLYEELGFQIAGLNMMKSLAHK